MNPEFVERVRIHIENAIDMKPLLMDSCPWSIENIARGVQASIDGYNPYNNELYTVAGTNEPYFIVDETYEVIIFSVVCDNIMEELEKKS